MSPGSGRLRMRVVAFLGCLVAGLLVGLIVRALGGGDIGFLALPALVVAGWLWFADPAACQPRQGTGDRRDGGKD